MKVELQRRSGYLRMGKFGPVTYGLIETIARDQDPVTVHLAAQVGDHHRRLGDRWVKVSDEDDLARAKALIDQHHDSLLALGARGPAAA